MAGNLDADLVSISDVENFGQLWSQFDPDADKHIPADSLPDLVRKLHPPMGLAGAPKRWAYRFCLLLGLEHHDNQVRFDEVLKALVNHNYVTQANDGLPPPDMFHDKDHETEQLRHLQTLQQSVAGAKSHEYRTEEEREVAISVHTPGD